MGFINIVVLKDVVNELQATRDGLSDHFKTTVIDGLKEDYSFQIAIFTPFKEGNLVGANIVVDTGDYDFYFDNEMYYYPYIILGTQPHWIGSPVMIDGGWVYIGMHPGTSPNDFMENAFVETDPSVDSRLDEIGSWIVGE
jgi:hypothetical protein